MFPVHGCSSFVQAAGDLPSGYSLLLQFRSRSSRRVIKTGNVMIWNRSQRETKIVFSVVSSCCFSIRSNGSCVSWVHLMLALPTEAWWPRWYEGCPLSWAGILGHMDMFGGFLQDGAPVRERMWTLSWCVHKSNVTMVYGRYIELINGVLYPLFVETNRSISACCSDLLLFLDDACGWCPTFHGWIPSFCKFQSLFLLLIISGKVQGTDKEEDKAVACDSSNKAMSQNPGNLGTL